MTVQKLTKANKKFVQRYRGEDYLAESIVIANKPKFALVKDRLISIVDNVGEYFPTIGLSRPYTFNSEKEFDSFIIKAKAETLDTLIIKVSKEWKKYSCADEFENALCAADTIFTYYQDRFGMTHYPFFVGSPDSGKSNKLCVFNVLAYRNFMSSDMTAANIYRHLGSAQECQGTICEDEADDLDEDKDRMRVYKMGYTSGFRVPRNDKEGNNGNMLQNGYFTYCWKAFAAERLPDSTTAKGFISRLIEIKCISDVPELDIAEVLNPVSDNEFIKQHNRLFEVRSLLFCYMLLHSFDEILNIKLNITNREKQLFKPLLRLFQDTKTQDYLFKVVSHFVNERRKLNIDTLLAREFIIINDLVGTEGTNDEQPIESNLLWDTIKNSLGGSDILGKPMSFESTEFGTLTQKGIIEMIKDNFKARPSRDGKKRSLVFSRSVLRQLARKYEVKTDVKVVTDVTDVTDTGGIGGTETPDDIDPLLSSSVHDKDVSYPSQTPDFEHVLEGLENRRMKNNPSHVSHIPKEKLNPILLLLWRSMMNKVGRDEGGAIAPTEEAKP